jgi:hypothetical protein
MDFELGTQGSPAVSETAGYPGLSDCNPVGIAGNGPAKSAREMAIIFPPARAT